MFENIKPFENKILIKKCTEEDVTSGGIILLESENSHIKKGIVVKVGKGLSVYDGNTCPMDIVTGNVIYYLKDTGIALDNDITILRRDEILGIK